MGGGGGGCSGGGVGVWVAREGRGAVGAVWVCEGWMGGERVRVLGAVLGR